MALARYMALLARGKICIIDFGVNCHFKTVDITKCLKHIVPLYYLCISFRCLVYYKISLVGSYMSNLHIQTK